MPSCPNCSEPNPESARFCSNCGTPLAPVPEPREARKVVTVVFTDVAGFTGIGERLDPEALRHVMTRYFDAMRDVLERHGGTVEKFIGDAVMAVFGVPMLHEDDALRAVRAASEMRDALNELNGELDREWGVQIRVRTGVNTGEVVAGDPRFGQSLVVGDAVNVAARLEQVATPGEILLGPNTQRLVRDAVEVEPTELLTLKGRGEPVRAFRLLSLVPGAPGFARRLDSPMVGRERERLLLQQAFDRAVEDRTCQLFTVLGAAGVGKSRLASEVISACTPEALVLTGRCLPYGEGITFWPVLEIVRAATRLTEGDSPDQAHERVVALLEREDDRDVVAARVSHLLGLPDAPADLAETWWGVRRFFEALARRQPLILIFDDLHWAEPALLDLIEYVAEWARAAPMLLVCLARPELLDARAQWGGGKLNATSILLEPLSTEASEALLENLLGQAGLVPGARTRIAEAAEGNPLFVEEMLSMLIDEGKLQRANGQWVPTTDLTNLAVPPTIQALLAARLDRLTSDERALIERASIEGKVFHAGAVAELAPQWVRERVDSHLSTLVRKELIRPERASVVGQDAFAFRHILVRDEAYRGMPKETRADLHERFAVWLERSVDRWLPDYQEIVGYHLEQAYRLRAELGPVGEPHADTARRAASHLHIAGRRAFERGDVRAASNLLQRAIALAPERSPERVEMLVELAQARFERGELGESESLLEEAIAGATSEGDERIAWHARLIAAELHMQTELGESAEAARREAQQAIEVFERLGDERGLAKAWHVVALSHWMSAEAAQTEQALENAAEYARAAGDRRQEAEDLAFLVMAASWGSRPIADSVARTEEAIERTPHRRVEAIALLTKGVQLARMGRFEEGRSLVRQGREILAEMGIELDAAATSQGAGEVELLAGDPGAAEAVLRAGYDTLSRMGEKAYLSTTAGFLAIALYEQGRLDEAQRFTHVSEENADANDLFSQVLWRAARAKVLARRGRFDEAELLARDAVTLTAESDSIDVRAQALESLGTVLRNAGRAREARGVLEEARKILERWGATVTAGRITAALKDLPG